MATWNQKKADCEALIAKKQNMVKFYGDTSDSMTWSFTIEGVQFAWTGSGGATAYWNAWRAANPDLDGTGTDAEIVWYEHWYNFTQGNVQQDDVSWNWSDLVSNQNAEITALQEGLLATCQAQIDAGNGEVDGDGG